MKCPNDNATLLITDRNGIEIDYCPECRGVWLDRGELDKLIERTGSSHSQRPEYQEHRQERSYEQREQHHYDDRSRHDDHHNKKHKKENFLEDFFDFG